MANLCRIDELHILSAYRLWINTLVEPIRIFAPPKNFVKRLAESFRNQVFSEMATVPGAIGNIQIRLVNSS